jgi:predicted site-specific integrase-resolvase
MIFRVDPKTVSRWVKTGRVAGVRTPGGQHRLRYGDVAAAFRETNETES